MQYSLSSIAIKNIKTNKPTMTTAFISVVLSVTLVSLILAFVSQAQTALVEDARYRMGGIDIIIEGEIAPEYVVEINSLDGVEVAIPIHQTYLQIEHPNDSSLRLNVYAIGIENNPIAKSRYEFSAVLSPSNIVVSETISNVLGLNINDTILVENREFEIVETIGGFGSNFHNFEIIILPFDDFSDLVDRVNGDYLAVALNNPLAFIENLSSIRQVNDTMLITTLAEALEDVESLSLLQVFIYFFAVIVIFACSFMVITNFQTFIERYRGQFSIMRTFGTSGKQLGKLLFIQGAIIVGSGALVGFLLTWLLHSFLFPWFANILSLAVNISLNISLALLVALVFSLIILGSLSILIIQSARILPIQIALAIEQGITLKSWKKKSGIILLVIAIILMLFSMSEITRVSTSDAQVLRFLSLILYGIAFAFLFSFIVNGMLSMIIQRWGKNDVVQVALANMKNNLLLSKNIILSISIIFFVAIFAGSVINTINQNSIQHIESNLFLDITLTDIFAFESNLSQDFNLQLIEIFGSEKTVILSYPEAYLLTARHDGMHMDIAYLSLEGLSHMGYLDIDLSILNLTAVVTTDFAEANNLDVGDLLTIWYNPNLRRTDWTNANPYPIIDSFTFIVGDIIERFSFAPKNDVYIDWSSQIIPPRDFTFQSAFIRSNPISTSIEQLAELRSIYPEIRWTTLQSAIEDNNRMFMERYGIFLVVLVLIIYSLSLGVINTILNGVYKRRKEYAVLRAIGMTQKKIASTIYLQVFLYMAFGTAIGVTNGVIFAINFARIIDNSDLLVDYLAPAGSIVILSLLLIISISRKTKKLLNEKLLSQMDFI